MLPPEPPCAKAKHIGRDHQGGQHLSHDCCQGCAGYPHIHGKKKQIIKDKIERYAGHRADQRVAGASVRADQECPSGGQGQKRQSRRDQFHIGEGIGIDLVCRTEQIDEPGCKEEDEGGCKNPLCRKQGETGSRKVQSFVLFPSAVADIEVHGGPVTEKQGHGTAQKGQRVGDRRSRIAQKPDPLSDEHLIDHIIEGGDQSTDDTGNSILEQEPSDRRCAQRINCFFRSTVLIFIISHITLFLPVF